MPTVALPTRAPSRARATARESFTQPSAFSQLAMPRRPRRGPLRSPASSLDSQAADYGCYVELISTKVAPTGLLWAEEERELAAPVPADDYRAIRRAILDLDKFAKSKGAEA